MPDALLRTIAMASAKSRSDGNLHAGHSSRGIAPLREALPSGSWESLVVTLHFMTFCSSPSMIFHFGCEITFFGTSLAGWHCVQVESPRGDPLALRIRVDGGYRRLGVQQQASVVASYHCAHLALRSALNARRVSLVQHIAVGPA